MLVFLIIKDCLSWFRFIFLLGVSPKTRMKQRIKALVTNIRPHEPLTEEKIRFIATRIPALSRIVSDTHFYDSSYTPLDSHSTVKVRRTPYRPSPTDTDSVRVAWKVFTGSKCRVYRPPRQPKAYGPTGPPQPLRPQPIPPVPLQMPWHPEVPEDANVEMDLTTEYSSQTLADGRIIYEILSQVKNAGGEEIPGLWRVSDYDMDGTVYLCDHTSQGEEKEGEGETSLQHAAPSCQQKKGWWQQQPRQWASFQEEANIHLRTYSWFSLWNK